MKIRVIICPPDRPPYVTYVSDTLENLQKLVGGYIETVTVASDCVFICNEAGRLQGLPTNWSCCVDSFVGYVIIAGVKGDAFTDLTAAQAKFLLQQCKVRWQKMGRE